MPIADCKLPTVSRMLITLTSDYGLTDHHLPALKGRLLQEEGDWKMVDFCHVLEPGNFFEAAFVLRNGYHAFPEGTVHLVAFAEISKNRKLLAAELDGHFFLLADNGLLPMINPQHKISKVIEIDLRQEDSLFPARDVLARCAGHLARGGNVDLLGRATQNFQSKQILRPTVSPDKATLLGAVVYIDNFGNLITNISKKKFKEVGKERDFEIQLPRNQRIRKLSESYFDRTAGTILALFNSQDLLEIAVASARGKFYNGANTLLGVEVQNPVSVVFR